MQSYPEEPQNRSDYGQIIDGCMLATPELGKTERSNRPPDGQENNRIPEMSVSITRKQKAVQAKNRK